MLCDGLDRILESFKTRRQVAAACNQITANKKDIRLKSTCTAQAEWPPFAQDCKHRVVILSEISREAAHTWTSLPLEDLSNICVIPCTIRERTSAQLEYGVSEFAAMRVRKLAMAGRTALRRYLPTTTCTAGRGEGK